MQVQGAASAQIAKGGAATIVKAFALDWCCCCKITLSILHFYFSHCYYYLLRESLGHGFFHRKIDLIAYTRARISQTVYANPLSAATTMLRTEGMASFYTGLGIVLAAAAPAQVSNLLYTREN